MLLRYLCFALVFMLSAETLTAQPRLTYESLRASNRPAGWYRQTISIPTVAADSLDVTTLFRIPYSSILFKKSDSEDSPLAAELIITFDALTATKRARRNNDPETSMGRVVWMRNVTAQTYELSRSDSAHVEGVVRMRIPNRSFRMVPIVQMNGISSPMAALPSPEPPPSQAFTLFLDPMEAELRPLNLGSNIVYGKKTNLLVGLRDSSAIVELWRLKSPKDSSLVWSGNLNDSTRIGYFEKVMEENGSLMVAMHSTDRSISLHQFALPSENFENTQHRIVVRNNADVLHQSEFLPRWFNIPTSLLNLDTAIDMLRFTATPVQVREIRKGTVSDRERKFKAFWKGRDPSPESAYNELMAEYYARIDQAYDQFTTPQRPGFDSIMGKTWILYGKPTRIERRFPADGAAIVVWEYPARRFIFRATSGFGDFELVSPP